MVLYVVQYVADEDDCARMTHERGTVWEWKGSVGGGGRKSFGGVVCREKPGLCAIRSETVGDQNFKQAEICPVLNHKHQPVF